MSEKEVGLELCPFCGWEAATIYGQEDAGEEDEYMCGNILCPMSGLIMPLKQWNMRAESPQHKIMRDALEYIAESKGKMYLSQRAMIKDLQEQARYAIEEP